MPSSAKRTVEKGSQSKEPLKRALQRAIEVKKLILLGLGCHRPASEEVDLLSLVMSALSVNEEVYAGLW